MYVLSATTTWLFHFVNNMKSKVYYFTLLQISHHPSCLFVPSGIAVRPLFPLVLHFYLSQSYPCNSQSYFCVAVLGNHRCLSTRMRKPFLVSPRLGNMDSKDSPCCKIPATCHYSSQVPDIACFHLPSLGALQQTFYGRPLTCLDMWGIVNT